MDAQSILAAKVAYLSGNNPNDIDDAMKQYVESQPALKQEVEFVEAFWHQDNDGVEEQPSANLDARFYQMLSQAQAAQSQATALLSLEKARVSTQQTEQTSLWQKLTDFLTPKPVMQFAMMAAVFTFGYYINAPEPVGQDTAINNLQEEVQSLSSLIALSMIENQSASKRLTGISYSKQSPANDEALNNALFKMINEDKSTAVRLAAIDALAERGFDANMELILAESVETQKLMVQISLITLLTQHGTQISQIKLKDMAAKDLLHVEAKEFFEAQQLAKQKQNQV